MSDMPVTPPMILESGALFTPRVSKLKPSDPPTFYLRALATEAAVATKEWKSLERTVNEFGAQYFGRLLNSKRCYATTHSARRSAVTSTESAGRRTSCSLLASNLERNIRRRCWAGWLADHGPGNDLSRLHNSYARSYIRLWREGKSFAPGIAFGLSDVQKLGDGPRLKSGGVGGGGLGPVNDDDDLDTLIAERTGARPHPRIPSPMQQRVIIDIETRSVADLRKTGIAVYAADPTTTITHVGWKNGAGTQVWQPAQSPIPNSLADTLADERVALVAHNAAFERLVTTGPAGRRPACRPRWATSSDGTAPRRARPVSVCRGTWRPAAARWRCQCRRTGKGTR